MVDLTRFAEHGVWGFASCSNTHARDLSTSQAWVGHQQGGPMSTARVSLLILAALLTFSGCRKAKDRR